jgi:hypothetical protein
MSLTAKYIAFSTLSSEVFDLLLLYIIHTVSLSLIMLRTKLFALNARRRRFVRRER